MMIIFKEILLETVPETEFLQVNIHHNYAALESHFDRIYTSTAKVQPVQKR